MDARQISEELNITEAEAETAIMRYLQDFPGKLVSMWPMLNTLCTEPNWKTNRLERQFYLKVLLRLVREDKVIRYRKVMFRSKIRISEAYV
jgi:DNA polymerase I-like protein with 3'-5' exonuclease and polymerase domains